MTLRRYRVKDVVLKLGLQILGSPRIFQKSTGDNYFGICSDDAKEMMGTNTGTLA